MFSALDKKWFARNRKSWELPCIILKMIESIQHLKNEVIIQRSFDGK